MLVPKLRFKREDGTEYPEWKASSLQDVSRYVTTTGTSVKCTFVGTENMRKGCAGVTFDDDTEAIVKGITFIPNDILVSNIRPYLKKAWKADREGICSTDVLCIRGNDIINSDYLYTIISSDGFFEYAMQGAKGTKMPRGDKKHIMEMPVFVPCLEEQQKIADFLSTVDEVIAQSEAEVQNLEQQKKAAMQKIFSQEVRFKREDGTEYPEWEEKAVGEICSVSTGKSNTQDKIDEGQYPFYVRSPIIEHSDKYLFDEEAVITVGDGVGTGKVYHYVNGKYNLHQRCYRMYDFIGVIAKYFYYVFSANFYKRIKSMSAKTSVDSVRMEMITNMQISFPCLEEQQKIADFLSAYDEAISYAKQELDKWKELKKGLLQQMFV